MYPKYVEFSKDLELMADKCRKFDTDDTISKAMRSAHPLKSLQDELVYDPRVLQYMIIKNGTPASDVLISEAIELKKILEF